MPRVKLRCRKCHSEFHKNYMTTMDCKNCGGLLVRIDSHLEKRIERAKKNFASDSLEYNDEKYST
jgi:Zn finger protein HypA/HybF involved in hydrogenase expression